MLTEPVFYLPNLFFFLVRFFIVFHFLKIEFTLLLRANFPSKQKGVVCSCSIALFRINGANLSSSFLVWLITRAILLKVFNPVFIVFHPAYGKSYLFKKPPRCVLFLAFPLKPPRCVLFLTFLLGMSAYKYWYRYIAKCLSKISKINKLSCWRCSGFRLYTESCFLARMFAFFLRVRPDLTRIFH